MPEKILIPKTGSDSQSNFFRWHEFGSDTISHHLELEIFETGKQDYKIKSFKLLGARV